MKKTAFNFNRAIAFKLCALLLFFSITLSCKKESTFINLPLSGPDQDFYVLANNNTLLKYNAKSIKTSLNSVSITGMGPTEKMLSIDFRPATGDLYGISDASKLYIINLSTGLARAVAATPITPAVSGTVISIDFNPTTDRLRLVSNTGQNLRINPETATVEATDPNISGGTVMGIAHTNSFAGASTTTLYDIDPVAKTLNKQDPQNNGTITKVADLDQDISNTTSLDISPNSKNVLLVGTLNKTISLFSIDLDRNVTKLVGKFTFTDQTSIQSIAIPTNPVAYATTTDANNANTLLIFDPTFNKTVAVAKTITGMQSGETVLGIDMRPSNGQVYALGSSNRLYTVNLSTGLFTQVGTGAFATALAGTSFGFDFSPQEDIIRVVSNTGQNLRINPITASISVQPNLSTSTGSPTVSAAAYSNNIAGSTTSRLYVIDHVLNKLYTQDQNSGLLSPVGDLKIVISAVNGFDISFSNIGDTAYGIFTVDEKNKLYQVNLSTGQASVAASALEFTQPITGFTLGRRL
ncbi:DUF4394 domain-containing protein [Pedobacter sp. KR3-3]|uniref:DUF4394 domain-containing protein n=1 Tax=Pedobacter albus TaxID=3113905 RepID=A0ABU7IB35_9SPHI|nr:DUF4394 domain-containing protein [Pedobacter sp. KR3-3]MEE1946582.1 DUF4394 domain-containing protein [Pedobacter sp. KR3-3]